MNSTLESEMHAHVIELLEKNFNTPFITNQFVAYEHPKEILSEFFEELRSHLSAEEYMKITHYGDRFLGQFILGNTTDEFSGEGWGTVPQTLASLQKKYDITEEKIEQYKKYRKLFHSQIILDVIDNAYLDFVIIELVPDFKFHSRMTLEEGKFRSKFFNKDFSKNLEDAKKRHIQLIFQKYYLKVFLNFIATNPM